jgi:hypothetical protein
MDDYLDEALKEELSLELENGDKDEFKDYDITKERVQFAVTLTLAMASGMSVEEYNDKYRGAE